MSSQLPLDYRLQVGSTLDRSLLVKFMQRTYQELYPASDFAHLAVTIEQYLSHQTPIWWVESSQVVAGGLPSSRSVQQPIAGLWLGNAIDQASGDRHAHIFLLYVMPSHRRQGIGAALVHHAESWARERGDRQISLQVFTSNQPALQLYQTLGYQTQS
ncbi:MAG: GNAT family N-acetyltransferase, partial [Phormidesmis sp. CAN_BIN36]|nr:GNAT family N-acetyltransferase [Phormidesmis sp. CAN_BIN36]